MLARPDHLVQPRSAAKIHASPRASKLTRRSPSCSAPVEADDEGVGPIERLGRLPPLDEHHPALFELLFEGEIDHLLQVLEPPKIDMGDRRGRLVAVGEGEGGVVTPSCPPSARHEALDERGLARAERADEEEDIAPAEQLSPRPAPDRSGAPAGFPSSRPALI